MGGLANYADACDRLLDELQESLSHDEKLSLRDDLASLGRRAWIEWGLANQEEVAAFVASTPSARRSRKKWQPPALRARLVLAAYYHVWQAMVVLDIQHELPLIPGVSYREMAVRAGDIFHRIRFGYEFPEWPFDGENPFK